MKKYFILLLIILACSGCSFTKEKKLTCTTQYDSELETIASENIDIVFHYRSSKKISFVEKTVTVELSESDYMYEIINQIEAYVKDNYCNSEASEDYQCDLSNPQPNVMLLTISGKPEDVIGVVGHKTIDEYQKMFEDKGFICFNL